MPMLADAVLRLAVAALPAASRGRYRDEWRAEASELPIRERLGYASRLLVRTPQLRLALGRPSTARQLVGGGFVAADERGPNPLITGLLVLTTLPAILFGAGIVAAGATVRASCAAASCVPMELARPEDGDVFRTGPLTWTSLFLYAPIALAFLMMLSVMSLVAMQLGLWRSYVGSASARFFVVALVLMIAVWVAVLLFAPEMNYVTNLTE